MAQASAYLPGGANPEPADFGIRITLLESQALGSAGNDWLLETAVGRSGSVVVRVVELDDDTMQPRLRIEVSYLGYSVIQRIIDAVEETGSFTARLEGGTNPNASAIPRETVQFSGGTYVIPPVRPDQIDPDLLAAATSRGGLMLRPLPLVHEFVHGDAARIEMVVHDDNGPADLSGGSVQATAARYLVDATVGRVSRQTPVSLSNFELISSFRDSPRLEAEIVDAAAGVVAVQVRSAEIWAHYEQSGVDSARVNALAIFLRAAVGSWIRVERAIILFRRAILA